MELWQAASAEFSRSPISSLGGLAGVGSLLVALALARPPNRNAAGASSPVDSHRGPIIFPFVLLPILLACGLVVRLIYEWNWFGGIVAFAIGGLIASVISGWLAAKFLNSWIDAGLVEETITLRGGKTETLQYVGGLEWPTFVSALCGIICGLLVSIIFAMFAGPFFGDLVALTAEGDRVEHPLQRADAASNAGIVSSFAVLLLLFGVPAACGLFFYVVRTVFQMQTQAE